MKALDMPMFSRHPHGQSLTELAAGLAILVPLILFAIDAVTLYLGASVNDGACHDAARAAAAGRPAQLSAGTHSLKSGDDPYNRAEAVVKKSYKTNSTVRLHVEDMQVVEQINDPVPRQPFGGPVDGFVTVTTKVTVVPPFLISAFVGPGGIVFQSNHGFPFTYQLPGTANSGSSDSTVDPSNSGGNDPGGNNQTF